MKEANVAARLVCDAVQLCLQVQDSLAVAKGDSSLGTTLEIPSTTTSSIDPETQNMSTTGSATGKFDGTPVTAADYGIQGYISYCLKKEFPNDRFMGEEDASNLRKDPALQQAALDMAQRLNPDLDLESFLDAVDRGVQPSSFSSSSSSSSSKVWILDPIDGTKGLMTGRQYIVGLALCISGKVVVAVMGNPSPSQERIVEKVSSSSPPPQSRSPTLPQVMVAVRGHGIQFCSKSKMNEIDWYVPPRVIPTNWHLKQYDWSKLTPDGWGSEPSSTLQAGVHYPPFLLSRPMTVGSPLPFGPLCRPTEICCGAQIKYWAVACGQVAGFIQFQCSAKSWDHAPGVLCVQESGGTAIDGNGDEILFIDREISIHKGIVCCAAESNDMKRHRMLSCVQETDITMS